MIIIIRKLKKDGTHNGQMIKVQKDKQRSTKDTHKAKNPVTRTQLKPGLVSSSCSTSGRMCGAIVIVLHASVGELGFDPVSGKLNYYKPDICCLQMLFIIKIIITESKMTIIWYMHIKFSDTNPDTCIL
jgi:hypothetical protein